MPGNSSLSARTGPVSNRQSPMDRRRTSSRRAFGGSLRNRSLVFNLCFADQHHRDIVAYRVYPTALRAFQSLSIGNND